MEKLIKIVTWVLTLIQVLILIFLSILRMLAQYINEIVDSIVMRLSNLIRGQWDVYRL